MPEGGATSEFLERRSFLLAALGAVIGGGLIASCSSGSSGTVTSQPGSIPTGNRTGTLSYLAGAESGNNDSVRSVTFSGTLGGLALAGTAAIPAGAFFPTSAGGTLGGTSFALVISGGPGQAWTVQGTLGSKSLSGSFQLNDNGASFSGSIGSDSVSGSWSLAGAFVTQPQASQPVSVKFDVS